MTPSTPWVSTLVSPLGRVSVSFSTRLWAWVSSRVWVVTVVAWPSTVRPVSSVGAAEGVAVSSLSAAGLGVPVAPTGGREAPTGSGAAPLAPSPGPFCWMAA